MHTNFKAIVCIEQSETLATNKSRYCINNEIGTLISKRLSVENKAKFSQVDWRWHRPFIDYQTIYRLSGDRLLVMASTVYRFTKPQTALVAQLVICLTPGFYCPIIATTNLKTNNCFFIMTTVTCIFIRIVQTMLMRRVLSDSLCLCC